MIFLKVGEFMEKENELFVQNFKINKVGAIDRAYEGTSLSKGAYQARLALKYILLNDLASYEELNPIDDKYQFLSSKRGGRELVKLMDLIDVYQILAKFAMACFALENDCFKIDLKEYKKIKMNKNVKIPKDKVVELVAFASYLDHYEAFMLLSIKKTLAPKLMDIFIDKRYKADMKKELDNFSGNINNLELKDKYFEQYNSLDSTYLEIRKETSL